LQNVGGGSFEKNNSWFLITFILNNTWGCIDATKLEEKRILNPFN